MDFIYETLMSSLKNKKQKDQIIIKMKEIMNPEISIFWMRERLFIPIILSKTKLEKSGKYAATLSFQS